MSEQRNSLVMRAMSKYGSICPCGSKTSWNECFSMYKGRLYFWFNTRDNSTRVEIGETCNYKSMDSIAFEAREMA